MTPRWRTPLTLVLGLLMLAPLVGASTIATETPNFPARSVPPTERLVVGYVGSEAPVALVEAHGATVLRVDPDLEFMVVTTPAPEAFMATLAAYPTIAYVEVDARVRSLGASWDGSRWDGSRWDGSRWDGASWDGSRWDGASWDGSNWDGSRWDGSNWDGASWDGAQWDGSRWDGATWDGSNWDGSRWDGARWDGSSDDGSSPAPSLMDPGYPLQWGHGAVRLPGAWAHSIGSGAPIVCVLDTGVDYTHPDLAPRIWTAPDGSRGLNVLTGSKDPMDDAGHGTHVAGIIAAEIGNGIGIAGVAKAKIMAVKVLGADGTGFESDLATGIGFCTQNGADVVSMSLGTEIDALTVRRAVAKALGADLVLVASAGNMGCACVRYPAAYPGVLGVGAIDARIQLTAFSNTGTHVDLVAPGFRIVSTFPGASYRVGSGTSQAAPYVSGVAALLLGAEAGLTGAEVRTTLTTTAEDLGTPGRDDSYGHGVLNAQAAIEHVLGH